MTRFKILRLDHQRSGILAGLVRSDDESWGSLDEALNELGETGWEIATPVYGPTSGTVYKGDHWLEALILRAPDTATFDDLTRRIEKTKSIIREKTLQLAQDAEGSPTERNSVEQELDRLRNSLGELMDKTKRAT